MKEENTFHGKSSILGKIYRIQKHSEMKCCFMVHIHIEEKS